MYTAHDEYIFAGRAATGRLTTTTINHVVTLRDCHDQQTPSSSPPPPPLHRLAIFSRRRLHPLNASPQWTPWILISLWRRWLLRRVLVRARDQPSTHCTCVYYRLKHAVNSTAARRPTWRAGSWQCGQLYSPCEMVVKNNWTYLENL